MSDYRNWETVQVQEICELIDYGYTASADFTVAEPRFLRITDIQDGQVHWEQVPGCVISPNDEAKKRLVDGDIVFARTGGTTGKSFLIQNPPRAIFASYLIRLRTNKRVLPKFLYLFFQSANYWRQIRESAQGAAQPNVNATSLGDITLALPPLTEQKRIVAILDEKLAAVERARAAAQAQLQAAQALPAAYLRTVFESEEAQEWPIKRIGEIAQTGSGTTPSRGQNNYYSNGAIPWIKTGELKDGIIEFSEEYVTELAVQETSLKLLPINTLLVAMYGQGQTRGRTGILKIPATINQACFAILPNPEIFDTNFLQLWFRHSYQILREESEHRGGNQPNLNGNIIRDLEVPLPSSFRQKQILAEIDAKLESVKDLEQALLDQLTQVEQLPAALLRQAFTGEL